MDIDGDGKLDILSGSYSRMDKDMGAGKLAPGVWLQAEGKVAEVPGVW